MKKIIKYGVVFLILAYGILLMQGFIFAEEADIGIERIELPSRIYLGKKTTIEITVKNYSDIDINGYMFSAEIDDGSKASQLLALKKNTREKIVINWVPQQEGELNLVAMLEPPLGIQEENTENNQISKSITVKPQ